MSNLTLDIKEYIQGRRTISFGNILQQFSINKEDLTPIIDLLVSEKKIRTVNSACTMDCGSCQTPSTCGETVEDKYRDATIVVSLYLPNRV